MFEMGVPVLAHNPRWVYQMVSIFIGWGTLLGAAGFVMFCKITYDAINCLILNILESWNQYILKLFRGAQITKTALKKY